MTTTSYSSVRSDSSAFAALLYQATRQMPRTKTGEADLQYQTIENEYCSGKGSWRSIIKFEGVAISDSHAPNNGNGYELTRCVGELANQGGNGSKNLASDEFLVRTFLEGIAAPMTGQIENAIQRLLNSVPNGAGGAFVSGTREIDFVREGNGFNVSIELSGISTSEIEHGERIVIGYKFNLTPDGWNDDSGEMIVKPGPIELSIPDALKDALGEPVEGWLAQMHEWLVNFLSGLPGIRCERVAIVATDDGGYSIVHTAGSQPSQHIELPGLRSIASDLIGQKRANDVEKKLAVMSGTPGQKSGLMDNESINTLNKDLADLRNESANALNKCLADLHAVFEEKLDALDGRFVNTINGVETKVDKLDKQINQRAFANLFTVPANSTENLSNATPGPSNATKGHSPISRSSNRFLKLWRK